MFNSRHPGPRREEGGLQAAGHSALPGNPGNPRESSRRLKVVRRLRRYGPIARKMMSHFRQNREDAPRHPQDGQGGPKDSQRGSKAPQREPKGPQHRPKATTRDTKAAQTEPKRVQGCSKTSQRGPKAEPRSPMASQRSPMAPQREFKGSLYTQKLPINRTTRPICYNLIYYIIPTTSWANF